MPDHHMFGGDFSPFMFIGPLMSMLWLAIVVYGVWRVARFLGGPHATPPIARPSAIEILRERYARGEIDTDTFEEMAGRLVRSEHHELLL